MRLEFIKNTEVGIIRLENLNFDLLKKGALKLGSKVLIRAGIKYSDTFFPWKTSAGGKDHIATIISFRDEEDQFGYITIALEFEDGVIDGHNADIGGRCYNRYFVSVYKSGRLQT